jgi:uncharacterized protein YutE (UPF0331/DUF86 family)
VTSGSLDPQVIAGRIATIDRMRLGISRLPLDSEEEFLRDPRNPASAESYLRRMLEALLDLGRHVLAKGFGVAVAEYREIGPRLHESGVLSLETADRLRLMARYRNRMVHFYDEVGPEELYEIVTGHLGDVEQVLDEIRRWRQERSGES